MDLVFMGTPGFAATILEALIAAGHRVLAVYTQPPRPAGRGHRLQPSPAQLLAQRHGLPVRCPSGLRDAETQAAFAALGADAAVVAAYGLILPRAMLAAPRLGCLNVHASLLPRWRGAAPVQRALLAGDSETGVTIMQMEVGLDSGPILMQQSVPIGSRTNAAGLTEELARLGGRMIVAALGALATGSPTPQPQPREGVAYASKISREEGRLDWRQPAAELERRVRALGAWFEHSGERIRVIAASMAPDPPAKPPGMVLDERLAIACGSGVLRLLRLQRPGRAPLDAAEFLRGYPIPRGTVLPCPATS
ncbi:MAG: methionyl-tRNA formyltransferase [Stellaceae bacterium]